MEHDAATIFFTTTNISSPILHANHVPIPNSTSEVASVEDNMENEDKWQETIKSFLGLNTAHH